jgi:hypothetical protein
MQFLLVICNGLQTYLMHFYQFLLRFFFVWKYIRLYIYILLSYDRKLTLIDENVHFMSFEVFMMVKVHIVIWLMTLHSLVCTYQDFGRSNSLHLLPCRWK